MTTQRDRLAAVLHDTICPLKNVQDAVCCDWHEPDADALIARGVRVVDAETLAAALGYEPGEALKYDCYDWYEPARDMAGYILKNLDAEPKP